jgi:hypothetical protein
MVLCASVRFLVYFTFSIPCIMIQLLVRCKLTNAHNLLESQECYNTPTRPCVGPHWPVVGECTVA